MLTLQQTHKKIISVSVLMLMLFVSIFSILPTQTVHAATLYPDPTSIVNSYSGAGGKYVIYKDANNKYYLDVFRFTSTTSSTAFLYMNNNFVYGSENVYTYGRYTWISGSSWTMVNDWPSGNSGSSFMSVVSGVTAVGGNYTVYSNNSKSSVVFDPNATTTTPTTPTSPTAYSFTKAGLYYIQYQRGTEQYAVEFDLNMSNYLKIILAIATDTSTGKMNIYNYSKTSDTGSWNTFGDVQLKKESKWDGTAWVVTSSTSSNASAAAMQVDNIIGSNIDIYNADKTSLYYSVTEGSKFAQYPYWALVEVRFPTQNVLGTVANWVATVLGKQSSSVIYYKYYFTDIPQYKEMQIEGTNTFSGPHKTANLSFIVSKGEFNTVMTGANASKTAELGVTKAPAMIPSSEIVGSLDNQIYVISSNFDLKKADGTTYTPPHKDDYQTYLNDNKVSIDEVAPVTKEDFAENMDQYVSEGLSGGDADSSIMKLMKLGEKFLDTLSSGLNAIATFFTGIGDTFSAFTGMFTNFIPFLKGMLGFLPSPLPEVIMSLFALAIARAVISIIRG